MISPFGNPLANLALAGGSFGALLGGLGVLQRRSSFTPEVARKLFHTGTGLLALAFPLLFRDVWPVIVLCAAAAAILAFVRWNRHARASVGGVLHAVERRSYGEFAFAAAIAIAFVAFHDRPLFYEIPIATLAFADAAAALVGSRFGRRRFRTVDGRKSLEGSLAFFVVAYACAFAPLLRLGAVAPSAAALVAFVFALMATWMEATCWRGGDNLGIPLVGGGVLAAIASDPLPTLLIRTGVLLALVVAVAAVRRRSTLGIDALMAALFFGYTFVTWGGVAYVVPPAILFLMDAFGRRGRAGTVPRRHRASAVVAACAPGLFWAFAAELGREHALPIDAAAIYAGYLATFAAGLGIFRFTLVGRRATAAVTAALACAPAALVFSSDPVLVAVVLVTTFAATSFFARFQPHAFPDCPRDRGRWWRHGLTAAGCSVGAFALIVIVKGA